MVKYDQYIINIFYDYIPYLYKNTLNIDILELHIDYREEAQKIFEKIYNLKIKSTQYYKKKIPSDHIRHEITKLEDVAKLYNTWGAIQHFYNINKNTFFSNFQEVDLHGLYQKESSALLFVILDIIKNDYKKIKIITGKGKHVIYNSSINVLKDLKLKYNINSNFILVYLK